jgi:AAA ATPase domain
VLDTGCRCPGRPSGEDDAGLVVISAKGEHVGLLLERDRQLEQIRGCLQRAREGHGKALVVEGSAGIGKTMLLAAARDLAAGEGFRVLGARGAELERRVRIRASASVGRRGGCGRDRLRAGRTA